MNIRQTNNESKLKYTKVGSIDNDSFSAANHYYATKSCDFI